MALFSDKSLSQRLERAEASFNASFVNSHAKLFPESNAKWIEVSGVYALFDGPESPLTQTFGLGLFEDLTSATLEKLETFFLQHGATTYHEVSPMADSAHMELLSNQGYRPIEMTSVMYKSLQDKEEANVNVRKTNPLISTRIVSTDEDELWARTSAEGWSTEMPGLSDFMYRFGQIVVRSNGTKTFISELNGKPISTGTLFIKDDVALLAGASTIPAGRNQGAQNMLLDARLNYASEQGCTIAMMCASSGSQSQRNAEKNGFRIAYTRTKWEMMSYPF